MHDELKKLVRRTVEDISNALFGEEAENFAEAAERWCRPYAWAVGTFPDGISSSMLVAAQLKCMWSRRMGVKEASERDVVEREILLK